MALGFAMSEAETHLHDDDPEAPARPGDAVEDRLATTRLPSLPLTARPPLPPARPPAMTPRPPSPAMSFIPPSAVTHAPTGDTMPPPASVIIPPIAGVPRTSWWRALLASTLPPSAAVDPTETALSPEAPRVMRARIAGALAVLGLASMLTALTLGFRGAPPALMGLPLLASAVVISRCLTGLGLLAVGVTLLRGAERIYFTK
jgi:hypothetical protein